MPDPCAHVGFGFLAARVLAWFFPPCAPSNANSSLALDLMIVLLSNLPDIVDKPLFLIGCTQGTRTYGHTILFLVLATALSAVSAAIFGPLEWLEAGEICGWESIARLVSVGIASHLIADCFFGYVPLLWPLPRWEFREYAITTATARKRAKRWKGVLDIVALVFVSFGSNVPQHVGGWKRYCAVLTVFWVILKVVIYLLKRRKRVPVTHLCSR